MTHALDSDSPHLYGRSRGCIARSTDGDVDHGKYLPKATGVTPMLESRHDITPGVALRHSFGYVRIRVMPVATLTRFSEVEGSQLPFKTRKRQEPASPKAREVADSSLIHCQNPGQLPEHLLARVKQWWIERGTYPDLVNALKNEGYSLYGPTISNWCRREWPEIEMTPEQDVESLLNLSPERQAIELLWRKTLSSIRLIRSDSRSSMAALHMMASTVGKIALAQQTLEKLETERLRSGSDRVKLLETAREQLKSEIRKILGNKPKLVDELCDIFDDASGNMNHVN